MDLIKEYPVLYAQSSKGKIKQWQVKIFQNGDGTCIIRKYHGYKDQKIQEQDKVVKAGKNISRSNETTVQEQAIADAQTLFNLKVDDNYQEEILTNSTVVKKLLPMKAQRYKDMNHKIAFPCYIQPKMNGVRCLATKQEGQSVVYTSKKCKPWLYFQHLTEYIAGLTYTGQILDGEIFRGKTTLNKIVSWSKKWYPETETLQYWIYDMIPKDLKMSFGERWSLINSMIPDKHALLVKVPTFVCTKVDDIDRYYAQFLKQGFEGAIVRNAAGLYRTGVRNVDLQKVKPVDDAEFKIVGGHEGTGTVTGCCVFECITEDGKKFSVMPKGDRETRKQYWKDLPKLVGKMLTVEFEEYSPDGIPLKPIGVIVRDYE